MQKVSNSRLYKEIQKEKNMSNKTNNFKRKTTRPVKTRKFKRTRTNRGLESMRDGKMGEDKRDHSQPSAQNDLGRQKTFDTQQVNQSNLFSEYLRPNTLISEVFIRKEYIHLTNNLIRLNLDQKISMMSTHLPPEGKELKIDGLMTNPNSQSTKNSVVKKTLKIKNGGSKKNENCEFSDPGFSVKTNMMSHSSFKRGERNIPKYAPLYKPTSSELSEDGSR